MTLKVFKKCCISSAVDGTDNDTLCDGSEEVGSDRSECEEEEESTGCEDGDSEVIDVGR